MFHWAFDKPMSDISSYFLSIYLDKWANHPNFVSYKILETK